MKTWMLVAAVTLAPLASSAQWKDGAPSQAANAHSRSELLKEIENHRAILLPTTNPAVTAAHKPRLGEIKTMVAGAKTTADLYRARVEFDAWKARVLRDSFRAPRGHLRGETLRVYSARRVEEMNYVIDMREKLAAQRVAAAAASVRSGRGSGPGWSGVFDQASSRSSSIAGGPADAVRAEAPPAANDPARYDKIRSLLLSQGVSSQIIDTAIAEGIRQKVDPMIVLSVINQESNFRKTAYNRGSGCVGLMQLDAATAADMGAHGSLYDASTNIRAGVKYLNWIANSFFKMNLNMADIARVPAQKLEIVLASYNWGIGNVRKALREHGAPALDRVAPKETRNYIAQIPRRISRWFAAI